MMKNYSTESSSYLEMEHMRSGVGVASPVTSCVTLGMLLNLFVFKLSPCNGQIKKKILLYLLL